MLSFGRKLELDDFISELKEDFFKYRLTYLKSLLYTTLKKLTNDDYIYLVTKIKEDKFLYSHFYRILLELNFEHNSAKEPLAFVEDKLGSYTLEQFIQAANKKYKEKSE